MLWTWREVNRVLRPRFRGCWPWLRQILPYSAKLAPGSVSVKLMGSIDRLMLIPYLPPGELGLYAVAYSLSRLVLVLQIAICRVLYPTMTGRSREEIRELHDLAFRFVLYAAMAAVLLISATAYHVVILVYGPNYAQAGSLLTILVIEAGLTCVGEVVIQLYLSLNQPGFPSMVQVLTLAVAAVLLFLLVPVYGASGAAYSLVAAEIVRLVALLGGIPVRLGMPFPGLLPRRSDARYVRARLL